LLIMPAKIRKPPKVKPIPQIVQHDDEMFVFDAMSVSRPNYPHRVELDSYRWNGSCTCEAFSFKHEPELSRGQPPSDQRRCSHIKAARSYFLDEILPKLAASLNGHRAAAPDTPRHLKHKALMAIKAVAESNGSESLSDLMFLRSAVVAHIEAVEEQQKSERK